MSIQRYKSARITTDSFRDEGYCGVKEDRFGEYVKYVDYERAISEARNEGYEEGYQEGYDTGSESGGDN